MGLDSGRDEVCVRERSRDTGRMYEDLVKFPTGVLS